MSNPSVASLPRREAAAVGEPQVFAASPHAIRPAPRRGRGLPFDHPVLAAGYAWWSVDAESEDGQQRLHLSVCVAPPFAAARPGASAPQASLHVALYGQTACHAQRLVPCDQVERGAAHLCIGRSRLRWERGDLVIDLGLQRGLGRRPVRGRVTVSVISQSREARVLDAAGLHSWWPVAPGARARVELEQPGVSWQGPALHEVRWGNEPPVRMFSRWTTLHTLHEEGALTACATEGRDGARHSSAAFVSGEGTTQVLPAGDVTPLGTTRWGLRPACPGVVMASETLEDTPYFVRSRLLIKTPAGPRSATLEHFDLGRWQQRWVQGLLPWRPRWQP
jgi:carotenoid 1,2-hydratase